MFDRFSDPARQAVALAQQEARGVGHDRIGSEHILLGLLREDTGAAARVLANRGVTLGAVRARLGEPGNPAGEGPAEIAALTPGARRTLEFARNEALALGHDHIGTEHLLLGLLREDDGVGLGVLVDLGVDPRAIRAELIRMVGGGRIEGLPGGDAHAEVATPPSFSAWLGTALTQASAEATADGRAIEVTDLLLALADDQQSPAGWVLAELGVDSPSLRATAEHLRLLDREIERVGREMHDAAAAQQPGRAGELRDQRRQLIAQRQRRPAAEPGEESTAAG